MGFCAKFTALTLHQHNLQTPLARFSPRIRRRLLRMPSLPLSGAPPLPLPTLATPSSRYRRSRPRQCPLNRAATTSPRVDPVAQRRGQGGSSVVLTTVVSPRQRAPRGRVMLPNPLLYSLSPSPSLLSRSRDGGEVGCDRSRAAGPIYLSGAGGGSSSAMMATTSQTHPPNIVQQDPRPCHGRRPLLPSYQLETWQHFHGHHLCTTGRQMKQWSTNFKSLNLCKKTFSPRFQFLNPTFDLLIGCLIIGRSITFGQSVIGHYICAFLMVVLLVFFCWCR